MDGTERVLLVEGQDDKHVVLNYCRRHGGLPNFCISDKEDEAGMGGIDVLLEDLGAEILVPGRRAIGILVDADRDLAARWMAVSDRLREEGIEVPGSPEPGGTLIQETSKSPRVGIWLMPDNSTAGELEDFVCAMIPEDDPIWPLAESYIDDIPKEHRKFTTEKIRRAKVHAWLATRRKPKQMGAAIGAGDLCVRSSLSEGFGNWLKQLFSLE